MNAAPVRASAAKAAAAKVANAKAAAAAPSLPPSSSAKSGRLSNATAAVRRRFARNRHWIELTVLIAVALVTLLLAVFASHSLTRMRAAADRDLESRPVTMSGMPGLRLSGNQPPLAQYNCDTDIVYSMIDAECRSLCSPPGLYRSHNGICVNLRAFGQTAIENECDPKRGLLAYTIGDPQFGTTRQLCLSVDPGVQPDTLDKENTFCTGGTIDINYLRQYPQLPNCACPDGQILAVIPSTSVTRPRGLCIDAESAPLYRYARALHNDTRPGGELPRPDLGQIPMGFPKNLVPGPEAPPRYLANYQLWRRVNGRQLFSEYTHPVLE
jgi:Per os infectivity factor 3